MLAGAPRADSRDAEYPKAAMIQPMSRKVLRPVASAGPKQPFSGIEQSGEGEAGEL
jgi:hypothetical protein